LLDTGYWIKTLKLKSQVSGHKAQGKRFKTDAGDWLLDKKHKN
jgi:hypothetical protein